MWWEEDIHWNIYPSRFRSLISMRARELPVSKMILPVFLIFLSTTLARSLNEGDSCRFKNGRPGTCVGLKECKPVMQELLAGKSPDTICGYSRDVDPIVCCPPNAPEGPRGRERPVSVEISEGDGRGAISRKKCAEYSKYVYVTKYSPVGRRRAINVNQCAIRFQKLVVGGTKAEPKEFPHMAAIGFISKDGSLSWRCGGSIISENFVLTAAHCTYSEEWGEAAWVRVGDLNLVRSDDHAKPVDVRVIDRIRHPKYKAPALYHDIALLRLETNITFNAWTRPACLHTAPTTRTQKAIATGWGRVEWIDEKTSDNLLKVTLPLINSQTCNAQWAHANSNKVPNGINRDWSICAGTKDRDTCQGDSGGPLVIFSKECYCMYNIVGVTSFGQFCGFNTPGIYTRVYHYVPWIESVVWGRG